MKKQVIGAIEGYQKYVSPYIVRGCRFHPTCSEYAKQAINKKGIFKGSLMAAWRVLRCSPFSRGGYDPVTKEEE